MRTFELNKAPFFSGWRGEVWIRFSRSLLRSPARVSILGFMLLITAGTFLLAMPLASKGAGVGWVNALFTATSASCVTGLVVLETGNAWSPFGQGVILALIQVGGLGIMTMSTLFLLIAGKRPSLTGQIVIKDSLTRSGERSLTSILRDVVLFTFVIEAVGMVFMFIRFAPDYGLVRAIYLSLFHSVSAFCNAGFSLFQDSFMDYREDWALNLVICFLIVCGGIGFLVLSEVKRQLPFNRRSWSRLSLHTKLVLTTTGILLASGSLLILLTEWRNTLEPLSVPGRWLAAFFQAVTVRTAGFNTLSIGDMANETLFLFVLLMFVGASPGSCGGGVKTTALAALAVLGLSRLRGKDRPQAFHRTIAEASVGKAVSVVMVGTLVVIVGTLALQISELGEVTHRLSRGKFLELLFEVVSAFGTVGLSTGVTAGLSTAGKLIITLVMFIGRLGPLVIAMAVTRRAVPRYYYAEESIMVG